MSNSDYKEFQFGWLLFIIVLPIYLVLTILFVFNIGDNPLNREEFFIVTGIFLLVFLLFYGMTTKIGKNWITISYGIGLIQKRIAIDRIKELHTVKTAAIYGWGIRIIPNGVLFNISGSDALELSFKDTKRIIRIGTKDPKKLRNEIIKSMDA
ncbi:MAG TPA: hypothetical protein VGE26_02825 [Sphingobacteriaceae bacterium]